MNSDSITILALTAYYLPGFKAGGPIKTINNLFDRLGNEVTFNLITKDRDLGDHTPYFSVECGGWNVVGNAQVFYVQPDSTGYWQIFNILKKKKYDIVYINSFFSAMFSIYPLIIAKILRQKVIIAPRGEFSVGALNIKSRKKLAFIKIFNFFQLHKGVVFQASSKFEAEDIKTVLGPAVDIQIAENIGSQEYAKELAIRLNSVIKVIFVSRISPMKNLLIALEMLKKVKRSVKYHVYGPIEDRDYWAKCQAVIRTLPEHIKVEYRGCLSPNKVVSTMAAYDLFFMPSKGENYGHVIAEALCAGLPVLIADTTPWRNLQEQGIGWDLSLSDPDKFSAVIDKLAVMPAEEYLKMRKAVLAWAKNKFSQRDAIEANLAMFRYVHEKK